MKRSAFRHKLPDPQQQIRDAHKEYKRRARAFGQGGRSRSGARGEYHEGVWSSSQWELECKKFCLWRLRAKEISNYRYREIITYEIFRFDGLKITEQIEVDHCFYDEIMKREVRADSKPPKVVHTKQGKRYPWKLHEGWFVRWDQLKIIQPEFEYQIWEKGNCYVGIDI